ncbi:sporulation protein YqfD [Fodinisporobacter ferrooxydans]|uniref:Sporulation protein YqfD n=1 Tax=Fodinisporobacter ferrooxydans TaxID=2901836 RepID=A0ABY4CFY4_9BACL|nr:sporulation protein YqfD [Alicyclobacillaceae bacterium MYW30-H2]
MHGQWILDIWKGYLIVTLYGGDIPNLLNQARLEQIALWNIRHGRNGSVQFYTYLDDFWRLRPVIRANRCKLRIGKRTGIPFWIRKGLRRKAFVAGFLVFLLMLYTMTSFVWSIDIEGTKTISPESVQAALRNLGIYRGAFKYKIGDLDTLQSKLLDVMPQLSWAGIQVHGTNITVQVVEKIPQHQPEPTGPQNVIAKKSGTITQILVHRGKSVVQKGQTVYKGELLITGDIGANQPVAASGTVKAQVWYTSKVEIPLQVTHKTFTGEKVKKDFLMFNRLPIQVWGYGQLPFAHYEEVSKDSNWQIGSFKLPVQFRETDYYQVQTSSATLSLPQAKEEGMKLIQKDVHTQMDANGTIMKQDVLQEKLEHGKLYMEILTEAEEDIGQTSAYTPPNSPESGDTQ